MIDALFLHVRDTALHVALSPGSVLSIWSLTAALVLACAVTVLRRRGRAVPLRVLLTAMFPRKLWGASMRADIWFTLFGVFASWTALGWAILSHLAIADWVATHTGGAGAVDLPSWVAIAVTTVALWIAYEFAYFTDHLLSHRIGWLWAFHKVHHTAETLSPLTVFRVHPIDSIVFYNIVAVFTGITAGAMRALCGDGIEPTTLAGTNILLAAAILTFKHLQHSHVWLAFTGPIGRIVMSPAHHQLHHSIAPEHHDRNFGETLAVFDWLYGSLRMPAARREPLVFGVAGVTDPHSIAATVTRPLAEAFNPILARKAAGGGSLPVYPASNPDIQTAAR